MKSYKCVILCGGQSLRTRFELPDTPKTLAQIEGKPLLHHILEYYISQHIISEFILCLGHEAEAIRSSFYASNRPKNKDSVDWRNVKLWFLDTGTDSTATYRIQSALKQVDDDFFFVSYADVVGNFDIKKMLRQHLKHKAEITIALAKTQMPYGHAVIDEHDNVVNFIEKPVSDFWINAGLFVVQKKLFEDVDTSMEFEREFLPLCIQTKKKISGFKHTGYWRGVDTFKDLLTLQNEWRGIRSEFFKEFQ